MSRRLRVSAILLFASVAGAGCTHYKPLSPTYPVLASTVRVERSVSSPIMVNRVGGAPCPLRRFGGRVAEVIGDSLLVKPVNAVEVVPDTPPGCDAFPAGLTVARAELTPQTTERKSGSWARTLGLLFGMYLGGALLLAAALNSGGLSGW